MCDGMCNGTCDGMCDGMRAGMWGGILGGMGMAGSAIDSPLGVSRYVRRVASVMVGGMVPSGSLQVSTRSWGATPMCALSEHALHPGWQPCGMVETLERSDRAKSLDCRRPWRAMHETREAVRCCKDWRLMHAT